MFKTYNELSTRTIAERAAHYDQLAADYLAAAIDADIDLCLCAEEDAARHEQSARFMWSNYQGFAQWAADYGQALTRRTAA